MCASSLFVDDDDWRLTGDDNDPASRLKATFAINRSSMHLEAWAVSTDANGIQVADDPSLCDLEKLAELYPACFSTVEIRGREYVLVATPYGI